MTRSEATPMAVEPGGATARFAEWSCNLQDRGHTAARPGPCKAVPSRRARLRLVRLDSAVDRYRGECDARTERRRSGEPLGQKRFSERHRRGLRQRHGHPWLRNRRHPPARPDPSWRCHDTDSPRARRGKRPERSRCACRARRRLRSRTASQHMQRYSARHARISSDRHGRVPLRLSRGRARARTIRHANGTRPRNRCDTGGRPVPARSKRAR